MTSGGDVLCRENAGLDIFAEEILIWIGRHRIVGRQVAAFGANDEFVALSSVGGKLLQGRANRALAALEAVVDGGIDKVDAVLHRGDDCRRVARISVLIGLAEVGADADRGDNKFAHFAEMLVGRVAAPFFRESPCSVQRGSVGHCGGWSPLLSAAGAGGVVSDCSGGASSLAQARIILRYGQPFSRKNISPSRGLL